MSHHTSTFTKVIEGKEHRFEATISKQEDGTFLVSNLKHTPPEGWTGWSKPKAEVSVPSVPSNGV